MMARNHLDAKKKRKLTAQQKIAKDYISSDRSARAKSKSIDARLRRKELKRCQKQLDEAPAPPKRPVAQKVCVAALGIV